MYSFCVKFLRKIDFFISKFQFSTCTKMNGKAFYIRSLSEIEFYAYVTFLTVWVVYNVNLKIDAYQMCENMQKYRFFKNRLAYFHWITHFYWMKWGEDKWFLVAVQFLIIYSHFRMELIFYSSNSSKMNQTTVIWWMTW